MELADLLAHERQRDGLCEQAAVEMAYVVTHRGRIAAVRHRPPQFLQHRREALRIVDRIAQHRGEAAPAQQADVLGEHREQAAHQEIGDRFRRMAPPLQRLADDREARSDVARDLGRAAGGVETARIEPYRPQPRANRLVMQIVEDRRESASDRETGSNSSPGPRSRRKIRGNGQRRRRSGTAATRARRPTPAHSVPPGPARSSSARPSRVAPCGGQAPRHPRRRAMPVPHRAARFPCSGSASGSALLPGTEAALVERTIAAIEVALHLVREDREADDATRAEAERRLRDCLQRSVRLLSPPAQDSFL